MKDCEDIIKEREEFYLREISKLREKLDITEQDRDFYKSKIKEIKEFLGKYGKY